MSNLILPSLPGADISVKRTPMHSTKVQTAVSGRELRASWQAAPRYKYALKYNFARSAAAYGEFQRLANFLSRHGGQYDSFLFMDPEDDDVTDHGFGVGDGVTTQFQLQRTLGVTVQDVLGTWPQYTKPRTNLLTRSQQFGHANWSKTGGGTGSAPVVTPNYAEAPDGTITAALVKFRLNGGATTTDQSNLTQAYTTRVGEQRVFSIWVKTVDGSTKSLLVEPASGSGGVVTVTGTWQRFSAPWTAASTFGSPFLRLRGGTGTSDSADVLVWQAQLEDGIIATRPIVTSAVIVTVPPAYWPSLGDGFEPVYDPAPGGQLFLTDWQGKRALLPYARTNVILQSETFDNASWVKSGVTVVANGLASPDGNVTADFIRENAANSQHLITQSFAAADNATGTISIWAKAGGRTQIQLIMSAKTGLLPNCVFDLSTGAVGAAGNGAVGTIAAYPDGWYRCSISANVATGGTSPDLRVYLLSGGLTTYTGDGSSGVWLYGAQAESLLAGSSSTPYIKTTTATVTVTDYAPGANGIVTLSPAPIANAALTWTGSYYRRVRVNSDAVESERILNQIWNTHALELISVKP